MRRVMVALAAIALAVSALWSSSASALTITPGNAALNWAEHYTTGLAYVYGADGPYAYDCSGLVSTAVLKADGIAIGRDTAIMLSTNGEGHFVRIPVADAQRGDVLFYGPDHVEFDTKWYHMSFGAHDSMSPIGWIGWGPYWYPTMAFRIVR
jgi:cell wall-associated NlpC family hydrolase